jgi:hypothetical protein
MTEEQYQFAATHYAGTQKMTLTDVRHLRQTNPDFIVLQYRLGWGLGAMRWCRRAGCSPGRDNPGYTTAIGAGSLWN